MVLPTRFESGGGSASHDCRKFNARYSTLGFHKAVNRDEGNMWPTSFAIVKLTRAVEKEIAALVKKAVG